MNERARGFGRGIKHVLCVRFTLSVKYSAVGFDQVSRSQTSGSGSRLGSNARVGRGEGGEWKGRLSRLDLTLR